MSNWAYEEVATADLGDRRLNTRLAKVLEQFGQHPQVSIPAACGGRGAPRAWTKRKAATGWRAIRRAARYRGNCPTRWS